MKFITRNAFCRQLASARQILKLPATTATTATAATSQYSNNMSQKLELEQQQKEIKWIL